MIPINYELFKDIDFLCLNCLILRSDLVYEACQSELKVPLHLLILKILPSYWITGKLLLKKNVLSWLISRVFPWYRSWHLWLPLRRFSVYAAGMLTLTSDLVVRWPFIFTHFPTSMILQALCNYTKTLQYLQPITKTFLYWPNVVN